MTDTNKKENTLSTLIPHKPGIKTTEFWATMLGTVLVAAASEFGLTIAPTSAIGIAAMVITYVVGRVVQKKRSRQQTNPNGVQRRVSTCATDPCAGSADTHLLAGQRALTTPTSRSGTETASHL